MLSYIISYNFFHLVGLVGLEKLVWLDADSRDSRRVTSYSSPGSNGTLNAPSWLLFCLMAFTRATSESSLAQSRFRRPLPGGEGSSGDSGVGGKFWTMWGKLLGMSGVVAFVELSETSSPFTSFCLIRRALLVDVCAWAADLSKKHFLLICK